MHNSTECWDKCISFADTFHQILNSRDSSCLNTLFELILLMSFFETTEEVAISAVPHQASTNYEETLNGVFQAMFPEKFRKFSEMFAIRHLKNVPYSLYEKRNFPEKWAKETRWQKQAWSNVWSRALESRWKNRDLCRALTFQRQQK